MVRVTARFVTSASDARHFPAASLPEIAFLGRSNVGKSSVINSLLGEKLAKTSSTPGRTRTINFFEVRRQGQPRPELLFADLPGYGYAKLSREQTAEWPKFIEPYLKERPTLRLGVVLIDLNVPPQAFDQQMVEWLQHHHRPMLLIGTKCDKLSGNARASAMQQLSKAYARETILPFSARTAFGRDEVWKEILQRVQGS